jgi:hypothetical protein
MGIRGSRPTNRLQKGTSMKSFANPHRAHTPIWLLVIPVLLLLSCSSLEMSTHHDPEADFSSYASYAWIEPAEDASWRPPAHLDRRLRRVIGEILDEKGFKRAVALPQADLLLVYYASVERELRVTSIPYGNAPYQYGYWYGAPYGSVDVRRCAKGTVLLDIIDRKAKQLVWSGQVTSAIQRANPPGEKIAEVARKLLASFPPSAD